MLVLQQTVLADCLSVYLSVWSPGQILGTRWDLTVPSPTGALTWGSSYDNDSLLCASLLPSLHDPCHFFRPCLLRLKLAFLLSEFLLFSCPLMTSVGERDLRVESGSMTASGGLTKKRTGMGDGFRGLGLTLW